MTTTTSTYTSSVLASQPIPNSWWLKDIDDDDLSFAIFIDGDAGLTMTSDIDMTSFSALGRREYVAVSDTVKGEKIKFKAQVFADDRANLDAMRNGLHVVLLQSDASGEQWYCRINNRSREVVNTTSDYSLYDMELVEVSRPAVT